MSNASTQVFDPRGFPLHGRRLIEASAGTGKTYNIARLYLRMVLGLGEGLDFEHPLPVEKILVVTFTRAAAGELRARVRALLELAYRDLRRGASDDDIIAWALASGHDRERMIGRLRLALACMDDAGISTIHSFAVRAAATLLFETGALDDVALDDSGGEKDRRRLTDIYRRLVADDSPWAGIHDVLGAPSLDDFLGYWKAGIPATPDIRPGVRAGGLDDIAREIRELQQAHAELRQDWTTRFAAMTANDVRDQLLSEWDDAPAQSLNPGNLRYLLPWLEKNLVASPFAVEDKRDKGYFKAWLAAKIPVGLSPAFDLLIRLRDHFANLESWSMLAAETRAAMLREVIDARENLDLREMSLDEVIRLVNQRLDDGATRPALQAAVATRYPVCLVDEFQDTDPQQFRMFSRIYAPERINGPGQGLFMVGDPKQSIYAFRGADLFAYLNVRAQVQAACDAGDSNQGIYSLDTNWRSTGPLVDAVNALFAEPPDGAPDQPAFIFEGMAYAQVRSCEARFHGRAGRLEADEGSAVSRNAMVFYGDPESTADGKAMGKTELTRRFAADTAARISAMLGAEGGARLVPGDKEAARPLRPHDIAVLVRGAPEARAIRHALSRPGIGLRSVFASQRDSVFSDSEVAEDVLRVVIAMARSTDRRALRTALATPLMRGFDRRFDELDQLDQDDDALDGVIAEFSAYRETWRRHGVLAALQQLMAEPARDLATRIARHADADRLLTDFRHLGDLLQGRDQACDSAEQLIDWFTSCLQDDTAVDEDDRRIRLESDEDLVRIVTIHVSKGLEYPVVFLPFFFLPRFPSLKKQLPLYRRREPTGQWRPVVDFAGQDNETLQQLEKEQLAEDMRLLYVAVTRARVQCQVGLCAASIGRRPAFDRTPWAHVLDVTGEDDKPVPHWRQLRQALERRLGAASVGVDYRVSGDVQAVPFMATAPEGGDGLAALPGIRLPRSHWRVTSYSGLARGETHHTGTRQDDDQQDQAAVVDVEVPSEDIRFTLPGSAHTGSCLHDILEAYALERRPGSAQVPREALRPISERLLARYALDVPVIAADPDGPTRVWRWLDQCLDHPLKDTVRNRSVTLEELFSSGHALPEMRFDFRLGGERPARFSAINDALVAAGQAPLERYGELSGLMTGAIDLVFEHDGAFYVLDYKSNTLGRDPRHYDEGGMQTAIESHRYDLQYMIYAVATERYLHARLGPAYAYDAVDGPRFGGVFYVFLRGMGLAGQPQLGAWFHRPAQAQVKALDLALGGQDDE